MFAINYKRDEQKPPKVSEILYKRELIILARHLASIMGDGGESRKVF